MITAEEILREVEVAEVFGTPPPMRYACELLRRAARRITELEEELARAKEQAPDVWGLRRFRGF